MKNHSKSGSVKTKSQIKVQYYLVSALGVNVFGYSPYVGTKIGNLKYFNC